ncbi:diaminohydroxyphosphoribosylaminopyrimidine deaminase [Flagellimonas flava]|uniref:Riboflavin biosynthesis protein RibD n=2 Tax=Flagellimonas flava TaxID=570519 RepID=A0A1M5I8X9_9FLAO|nr:diaminohydroxyphosphoribosylaminopyrimidine deaminase [Allomuricauda flava]
MRRCIELGKKGLGSATPNPMVGCVVVCGDRIIGEGFTSPYGGPHAEVNAIRSVKDEQLLKKSSLYVTLEPCSHFGKTPPCSDLIIASGIPKIFIGLQDPHDKVAGNGIQKLKDAGCEVTVGILDKECRDHHKRFLTYQEQKRPYIILKWAETQDGFIAPTIEKRKGNPQPFWITNGYSKQLVHKWRSEEQGILVGTQTVMDDNPKLTVRNWEGKSPVRVVLDRDLKTPQEFHVLDGDEQTIVLTAVAETKKYRDGIAYEIIDFGQPLAAQISAVLYRHQITSVIIEGGAQTLQTFIYENLWDEARVFKGTIIFGDGILAPEISESPTKTESILADTLSLYYND